MKTDTNRKFTCCGLCVWGDSCEKIDAKEASKCKHFSLLDDSQFESVILPYLREHTPPSNKKRLTQHILKNRDITYTDLKPTLDEYYVSMINDTLHEIRSGRTAYIFNLEQVRDIIRFEPRAEFTLYEGIYYVNLPRE